MRTTPKIPYNNEVMLEIQRVRSTIADLEGQLHEVEAHASKLRHALNDLRGLLPSEGPASAPPAPEPVWAEFLQPGTLSRSTGQAPSGHAVAERRPKLRDAIPILLRERPEGMNLARIAEELWARGWVGGKDGNPSIESVRQVMLALQRNGITVSHSVPNEKAPIWRLSDKILPRPPVYTPEEEAQGI